MKRAIRVVVILGLLATLIGLKKTEPAQAEMDQSWPIRQVSPQVDNKIDPALQAILNAAQPGEMVPVIVTLRVQADLSRVGGPDREARRQGLLRALQAIAQASQRDIKNYLQARMAQGLVSQVTDLWVFNGLSVTAVPEVIDELAAREDVSAITPDEIAVQPRLQVATSAPEPNLTVINAPALWDMGYFGQGVVVASMDTGVDLNHPDLSPSWRGGSNSWLDPYAEHPFTPTDLNGHGTWAMGVMVGGDAGGTGIGVAPQSQWIAVKIFNDSGSATATAIHQGFQWLLDPDGNIASDDAPQVVNNSWTFASPGCNLEFDLDLQALRAAGILPVFAAGNGGPYPGTSYSPSNNPSAFAVGATDNDDNIYLYSSRGPSSCGELETIYPELVAPGVGIYTTERYSLYTFATGTSLAAPHVSGGLALLLSAFPEMNADEQANALQSSAFDLGNAGPDNTFGFGRLDVLGAYQAIQAGGATPVPTATASPTATATPTAEPPTPTPTPTSTPEPIVNLAFGKPVTVSSFADDIHNGSMAVDGDLSTFWQSKKAIGKKVSSSEWIEVDLGSQSTVSQVILEWESNYASEYTLQVSQDNNTWNTIFSTASEDGGNDTIDISTISTRYVKLETTGWNDASLRTWLKEFEIYGSVSNSPPTSTPTPTPTQNPPTPTATPSAVPDLLVHIGDLDGSSSLVRNRWEAQVSITVHDQTEQPIANAQVTGVWSGAANQSALCTTDSTGLCIVSVTNLKTSTGSVTFTVSDISGASLLYQPADNHDPDGDSDGSSLTIFMP